MGPYPNVNMTLIFSPAAYEQVILAYLNGLSTWRPSTWMTIGSTGHPGGITGANSMTITKRIRAKSRRSIEDAGEE
jgi:hypothetical protein